MSNKDLIKYWFDTAEEDWKTAEGLLNLGHYMQALFYVHIALEKYFKGLIVKDGKEAPFDHNLLGIAKIARIDLDNDQLSHMTEINTFNIRARYDDYKRSFFKKNPAWSDAIKIINVTYAKSRKVLFFSEQSRKHPRELGKAPRADRKRSYFEATCGEIL